jgi:hypothetical protein
MMMNRLTICRRLPISFFLQCNACTVVSYNNVRQNVSMRIYIHTPINHGGLGAHLINLQGSKVLVDIVSIERRCLPTSPWPSWIESHAAVFDNGGANGLMEGDIYRGYLTRECTRGFYTSPENVPENVTRE